MKKEEIRIRVTPRNVKEFIEVLRRNGEKFVSPSNMFNGVDVDPEKFMNEYTGFRTIARFCWNDYWQITSDNEFGTVLNWTPQDLDDFLAKEKYARLCNNIKRAVSLTNMHERPYVPDEHIKSSHVVNNADGTASSVTLRDDKAVVEMPNGTLRIVDKSNLYKIV